MGDTRSGKQESGIGVEGAPGEQEVGPLQEERPREELLLEEFPLVLGPGTVGPGRGYFVTLTLANPGSIPCEVSFELPGDPDVGDCPWVQQLPSAQRQRTLSLLARKIYSVAPQRLVLGPGEQKAIAISYAHVEEGVHELTVLVKVKAGRCFFLHLIGSTLAEGEPALIAPVEQRLLPVALGEAVPPRQYLKLSNPGSVPVRYRLGGGRLVWDEGDPGEDVGEAGQAEGQAQSLGQILRVLKQTGVLAPGAETALTV